MTFSLSLYLRLLLLSVPVWGTSFFSLQSQTLEYAGMMGSAGAVADNRSVLSLGDSNMYVMGIFFDSVDVDPGPGVTMLYASSPGWTSSYLVKLDYNGTLLWYKLWTSTFAFHCRNMVTGGNGNLYLAGYFSGTADFDPGPGTYMLTGSSASVIDSWYMKLDKNGNFIWARQIENPSIEFIWGMDIDYQQNLYISGDFYDTADWDPGPGVHLVGSQGQEDAFFLKLDSAGNFGWVYTYGDTGQDAGFSAFPVDVGGGIILTGRFQGTIDFDPGAGTSSATASGDYDGFIVKLNSSGVFEWKAVLSGTGNATVRSSMVHSPPGHIMVNGFFTGDMDADPGAGTTLLTAPVSDSWGFLIDLTPSGTLNWAKPLECSFVWNITPLRKDYTDHISFAVSFEGTLDADPGPGSYPLVSNGSSDMMTGAYTRNGDLVWAYSVGDTSFDYVQDLTFDNIDGGHFYACGYFNSTVDFDPGAGSWTLTAGTEPNGFVTRIVHGLTAAEAPAVETGFPVYPNPATDDLMLDLRHIACGDATIRLINLQGQTVAETTSNGRNVVQFSLEKLPAGVYTAECRCGNSRMAQRFVKQ